MGKQRQNLIVILACGLILLMAVGTLIAYERQSCTVYTFTQSSTAYFTANSPPGTSWHWRITMHTLDHPGYLAISEDTQTMFSKVTYESTGGSLTGIIQDGHTYTVSTYTGTEPIPGWATCSVGTGDYGSDNP